MSPTHAGLICCLTFVTLEAFQAVYLGSVFQRADSFVVGSLVFGISVVGCTLATAIMRPSELLAAFRAWRIVVALNILAAVAWITYFFAIQLIEPAVVFTIFSGMVPLGTVIAGRIGLPEAWSAKSRFANTGHWLIGLSMVLLAAITAFGLSGFVRGGWSIGLLGAALSALSGGVTALVILLSVRLNRHGVGPLAQYGLRFVLYTVLAVAAFLLRAGRQGPASATRGPGMDRHGRTAGDRISSLPGSKGGSAAAPLIDSGHHRIGASHRVPDATFRRSS